MSINICRILTSTLKSIKNTGKIKREWSINKRWALSYKFSIGNLWKSFHKGRKRDLKQSPKHIWISVSKTIIETKNKICSNHSQYQPLLLIKRLSQRLIQTNTLERLNNCSKSTRIFKRTSNVFSKSIWTLRVNKLPSILWQLILKFLLFGKNWRWFTINTRPKTTKRTWILLEYKSSIISFHLLNPLTQESCNSFLKLF